jgi:hypothetical protein
MSAVDDYKMALNILAKTGLGSPDFIKEYAKSKAILHQFDSMGQIQAMNNSPMMANQGATAPISAPVDTSTPLGGNAPNTPQNQPPAQNEGQGSLQLPQ